MTSRSGILFSMHSRDARNTGMARTKGVGILSEWHVAMFLTLGCVRAGHVEL